MYLRYPEVEPATLPDCTAVEDFQSIPPQMSVHLLVRPEVGLVRVAIAYPVAAQGVSAFARLLASSERLKSRHGIRHYRGSVENILGHRGVCILQNAPFPLGAFPYSHSAVLALLRCAARGAHATT